MCIRDRSSTEASTTGQQISAKGAVGNSAMAQSNPVNGSATLIDTAQGNANGSNAISSKDQKTDKVQTEASVNNAVQPGASVDAGSELPSPHAETKPRDAVAVGAAGIGNTGNVSLTAESWVATIETLPLSGMAAELAANTGFIELKENRLDLSISSEHEELDRPGSHKQFESQLKNLIGPDLIIQIETQEHKIETLAQKRQRLIDEAQRAAEASIAADPLVQTLLEKVDGEVDKASIQPINAATPAPG